MSYESLLRVSRVSQSNMLTFGHEPDTVNSSIIYYLLSLIVQKGQIIPLIVNFLSGTITHSM